VNEQREEKVSRKEKGGGGEACQRRRSGGSLRGGLKSPIEDERKCLAMRRGGEEDRRIKDNAKIDHEKPSNRKRRKNRAVPRRGGRVIKASKIRKGEVSALKSHKKVAVQLLRRRILRSHIKGRGSTTNPGPFKGGEEVRKLFSSRKRPVGERKKDWSDRSR